MFDKASLKLGLDKAVLQDINRKGSLNGVRDDFILDRTGLIRVTVCRQVFSRKLSGFQTLTDYFFFGCGSFQLCVESLSPDLYVFVFLQVQQLSKLEVEDLLKKGAYGALMDEEDEGSKFCEEDIDQILQRRTQTITIQSEGKGSTFAKVQILKH